LWKSNAYFPLHRTHRNGGEKKSLGRPDAGLDAEPDARSDTAGASSQFTPRAEAARALARPVGRGTDASGQSPRGTTKHTKLIGRGGAYGHDRSDTSGREWVLTRIDRTLALWCPVSTSDGSGHVVSNANQWRPDA
jgi:hypothetical protein